MALRFRSLAATLTLALSCACSDVLPERGVAQSPLAAEAWITTDADGAHVIGARLGAGVRDRVELDDLVALRVPRSALAVASSAMHEELDRCGGFMLQRSFDEVPTSPRSAQQVVYAIDNAATVTPLMAELSASSLLVTIQELAAFPTRFHDSVEGEQAALWLRDLWQTFAEGRNDVSVELITHENTPQPSVALTISGATQPGELVILGGHLDSVNWDDDGPAPGADDNASGIAVLTETIRAALELGYRPDRSVVFYAYAAEEVGLVGSGEIAADAAERGLDVAGVLQLDMTNYTVAEEPYLALITDHTDPALTGLGKQLIDAYVGLPWMETECGYACSDHGSWNERGFPVHYVHESTTNESNELIHTALDTLELSDGKADHSLHFARYSVAFMAELAKGEITPETECDATRPCADNASCEDGVCVTSAGGSGGGTATAGTGGGGAGGSAGGGGTGGAAGSPPLSGGAPSAGAPARAERDVTTTTVAGDCSCSVPGVGAQGRHWMLLAAACWAVRRRRRASAVNGAKRPL